MAAVTEITAHLDRRRILRGGVSALLALALLHRRSSAKESDWQAEWAKAVAAAKREGKLVLCAGVSRSRRDYILSEWKKDFPEIEMSYSVVSSASFLPAVATERSAGRYLWDVMHSGPPTALAALDAGYLQPLLPQLILPEVTDPSVWGGWADAFYDAQGQYVLGLFSDVIAPYYNARLVPPEKVARLKLGILLDPIYKGKIVWSDPRVQGPGAPFLLLFERVLGADGLRRLVLEQDPIFLSNANEIAAAVARGKAAIAIASRPDENMREFVAAGLDLDIRSIGNGPDEGYRGTGGGSVALFNNAPHPNAARLFANWIMTKRISVGVAKAQDLNSRRTDIPLLHPDSAAIPGAVYVDAQRREGDRIVRQWQAELKRLRPQ